MMIQATASHAGKSLLAAALCRWFARQGLRVAPFKAWNMSLNAAPAAGGEIGWAQALQASACGIEARVEMNPVLVKPSGPGECQLILSGQPAGRLQAGETGPREAAIAAIRSAWAAIEAEHDLVVLEGAGSPAEINLLDRDLANMWMAREADAPVLVVGDIDRGGVFAALLGTWMLAPEAERIRGFIINKFRGDARRLEGGLEALQRKTGVPTLGIVPYHPPELPEEDALGVPAGSLPPADGRRLRIGVVRLPHMANFSDFDSLALEPETALAYSFSPRVLAEADVLILPGTRATVADLAALRAAGLEPVIRAAAAAGKPVWGICGGYQMLAESIADPEGVETDAPLTRGLGLLPVQIRFERHKRSEAVAGECAECELPGLPGLPVRGYFMQHGRAGNTPHPLFSLRASAGGEPEREGCLQGSVAGTALHDIFNGEHREAAFRRAVVAGWRRQCGLPAITAHAPLPGLAARLDAWTEHVIGHLDMAAIARIAGL